MMDNPDSDGQDHKVGLYDPVCHGCIGRVFRGRCLHDGQDHKTMTGHYLDSSYHDGQDHKVGY